MKVTPALWAAVGVLAAVLALALWWTPEPPADGTVVYTPERRIELIREAWDDAGRHTAAGCPTVAELERMLPALRGVHSAERDYVGWLVGVDC